MHAIFFDGNETPTFVQSPTCDWRPPKRDVSWRVEDETTGRVIDEYHPSRRSTPLHLSTNKETAS